MYISQQIDIQSSVIILRNKWHQYQLLIVFICGLELFIILLASCDEGLVLQFLLLAYSLDSSLLPDFADSAELSATCSVQYKRRSSKFHT